MSIFKNRKTRTISVFVLAALIIGVLGGAAVFARNDDVDCSIAVKELAKKTQNEFGEIVAEGTSDMGDKKLIKAEDDKYSYKADSATGKIVTMVAKDYDKLVRVDKSVSKDKISLKAEKCLSQFANSQKYAKFSLKEYKYKDTENEKIHSFIYEATAPNGVKTGEGVALEVNNDGELILLAIHEGNEKVAMEEKPVLNQTDAEKVFGDSIRVLSEYFKDKDLKASVCELSVLNDKLVWAIKIEGVMILDTEYGFECKIDAKTGEILFKDSYCVLK